MVGRVDGLSQAEQMSYFRTGFVQQKSCFCFPKMFSGTFQKNYKLGLLLNLRGGGVRNRREYECRTPSTGFLLDWSKYSKTPNEAIKCLPNYTPHPCWIKGAQVLGGGLQRLSQKPKLVGFFWKGSHNYYI